MGNAMPRLHVFAARFNPIRYEAPERHYRDWVGHILDSGCDLTVVEVQTGDRPFTADLPGVNHIGLRADSFAWSKERALNVGVHRTPAAQCIAWGDADVWHRRADWARETVHELQHYRVVQTWNQALDLGPAGEIMQVHRSFADVYRAGGPVVPKAGAFWKQNGGPYDYPHTGYFWAAQRGLWRRGGLIDIAAGGSGDHHMALGMVGQIESSVPGGMSESYRNHLTRWQDRVYPWLNRRIGVVTGVIEHRFHGSKAKRGYQDRWKMFIDHGFDPDVDLMVNDYGMFEFAGNKPGLEHAWDQYLRSRAEDDNAL